MHDTDAAPHGPATAAVVLAGGAARRMGGADKPGLVVGGRTLLEGVVAAVRDHSPDSHVVVVGPERSSPAAEYVREDPPGGGPVPALRAGLARVHAARTALLAADLPHLRAADLAALEEAAAPGPGAVYSDAEGHPQWLTGLWHTEVLRGALERYEGASLRRLLGPLGPVLLRPADERAVADCDTPESLARARTDLDRPDHPDDG
ncbi:NTP transferase domain-containing protein [Nocardiopsis sp. HNM0947]|uniref:NTP transferase domain-containing protein n=1 Tax=Nocardiopsis coralli TaxID=2772213 RepID=A0ABR9P1M9_9ACTN|nr:NTP transferase domain-containing protein [Nocardiopsis coralli]MBE2997737.1 NTP transferase domain-containing protein [Nocardiopsis coralli]